MMRTRSFPLVAVLALALPLGVTLLPAQQVPVSDPLPDFTRRSVICVPGISGVRILAQGEAEISAGPVGGAVVPAGNRVDLSGQTSPLVLSSPSRFAAGSLIASGSSLAWAPCTEPRTVGAIQFARPKSADLLLVNDDDVEATVDLTLFGPTGEIPAIGSRGIAMSPRSSRIVPISTLVPDDRPVGVLMQTTTGRVVAVGRSESGEAKNFEMLAPAGKKQLLPAIPAGSATTTLVVSNPGESRAKVNVSAFATQKFALANAQEIEVAPKTTITLDLTAAISGAALSLEVTSDADIIATAMVGGTTDFATSSSSEPLVEGRAFVPAGGNLSITNSSEVQTKVTVTSTVGAATPTPVVETTLNPGQTWTAPMKAEGEEVSYSLLSSSPVLAAVTFNTPAGVMITPFTAVSVPAGPDTVLSHDSALR